MGDETETAIENEVENLERTESEKWQLTQDQWQELSQRQTALENRIMEIAEKMPAAEVQTTSEIVPLSETAESIPPQTETLIIQEPEVLPEVKAKGRKRRLKLKRKTR